MSVYSPFTKVDLFCGAGLESAASQLAMEDLGIKPDTAHAINHWSVAVQVHGKNFPFVRVHQEDITKVSAATFGLDDGRRMVLWASPSCVHFSKARGGKPKSNQQRSHADEVIDRWIVPARPGIVFIENVPDFATWGPLDDEGQVIKERKGEYFRAFVHKLKELGYRVDWKILFAADYGDPTTRQRFFLQAVLDDLPITWPEPTHADPRKAKGLFDADLKPWRTAAECIDWSIPCPSIFERKKPLAEKTLRRIAAGLDRFVLGEKRPFIVNLTHGVRLEDLHEPLKTVTTANRGEKALVAPVLVHYHSETTASARASSLGDPVPTLDTSNRYGLVAAFLAKHYGGVVGTAMDKPVGTVTGTDHHSLVAATLVQTGYGEREGQAPRALDIEQPLGTIVAGGQKHALVAASLIGIDHASGNAHWPADAPLATATTKARHALVAAFLTSYYGTVNVSSVTDPLDTVTTKDRHGLVTVVIDGETYAIVDIGMRMLEPHELARAMSIPDWYVFERLDGRPLSKKDRVKMIGNGVPVETARALIRTALASRRSFLRSAA